MAVEEDGGVRVEVLQKGEACAELVDKKGIGLEFVEFARVFYLNEEMRLTENGAKDAEAR